VEQLDVVTAYLEADIEEEIYMRQPEGFRHTDINGEERVCLLKKSLYGLKQAPRNWNKTITAWLEDYGFTQFEVDPGIYVFIKEDVLYVLTLYVYGSIIVGPTGSFIVGFKSAFGERLNVQDLGPMSWLLSTTTGRGKHRDVRYHFCREKVESGDIEVQYCATENMLADVLTKPLVSAKHSKLCNAIMGLRA
jgi:hypothetical protein